MKNKLITLSMTFAILLVMALPLVSMSHASTITEQVSASTDDCTKREGYSPRFDLDRPGLVAGGGYYKRFPYYKIYFSGMRFQTVNIPQGAIILEAKLKLKSSSDWTQPNVKTKIQGQDSDDANTFSTKSDYDSRPRTTAKVDWDFYDGEDADDWTKDVWYESPDIKTVVQEIVNRNGWSSGNDMVIFWEDDGTPNTATNQRRGAYTYDESSSVAPKLQIKWAKYFFFNDDDLDDDIFPDEELGDYWWARKGEHDDGGCTYMLYGNAYLESREESGLEWTYSEFQQGKLPHGWGAERPFRYEDGTLDLNECVAFNIDPFEDEYLPEDTYYITIRYKITDRERLQETVHALCDPLCNPWTGIGIGIACEYQWRLDAGYPWEWSDYDNDDPFHTPSSQLYIDIHLQFRNCVPSGEWVIPPWTLGNDIVVHAGTKYDNDLHVGVLHQHPDVEIGVWQTETYDLGKILNDVVWHVNFGYGFPFPGWQSRNLRVRSLVFFVESTGAEISGQFDYIHIWVSE